MDKIAVLAGSRYEAECYIKLQGKDVQDEYVVIKAPEQALRMWFKDYVVCGSFWEREHACDLLNLVIRRMRK